MKKILILMTAAIPLFYSCSKNNEASENGTDPDKPATAAEKLQASILGKWEFDNVSLEGGVPSNERVMTSSGVSGHIGIIPGKKVSGDVHILGTGDIGYIEFLTDSTYFIKDAEGYFFQGKFKAVDGDSIVLGKWGTIGSVKLVGGQLKFALYYATGPKKVEITADKVAPLNTDYKTTTLSRSWYLTTEDYGAEVIGSEETGEFNEQTQDYDVYIIDSVNFIFTSSGTFVHQEFSKNKITYLSVYKWKWHSTKQDRIVFYLDGEQPDEEKDFLKISSLTNAILKVSQFDDADEDGNIDELKVVLKPAL